MKFELSRARDYFCNQFICFIFLLYDVIFNEKMRFFIIEIGQYSNRILVFCFAQHETQTILNEIISQIRWIYIYNCLPLLGKPFNIIPQAFSHSFHSIHFICCTRDILYGCCIFVFAPNINTTSQKKNSFCNSSCTLCV